MLIPSSSTNKWSDTEKCDRLSYKEAKEPCIGTETVIHSTGIFSSSTTIPRIPASSFQKEAASLYHQFRALSEKL